VSAEVYVDLEEVALVAPAQHEDEGATGLLVDVLGDDRLLVPEGHEAMVRSSCGVNNPRDHPAELGKTPPARH
jgi:hypothetical protein